MDNYSHQNIYEFITAQSNSPCTGIYGDLNGDGIVDVVDRLYLEQYLAGTRVLDSCQLLKADVNDDGVIDATDALMITNYYMNLDGAKGYTGQPLHAASNGSTPIGTVVCYTDYNLSGYIYGWNASNNTYIVFIDAWHNNNAVIPTKLLLGACHVQCVPDWQCEQPLNGYEKDGCGNRRLNSACNPCTPNWVCEKPLNGYEFDGCGNRRLNSLCNPCVPNWQCEPYPSKYEFDGCGNKRINNDCNPCTPNWQCELPLNGYEMDGCGNRRQNAACGACTPHWHCEQPLNGYEIDDCGNKRVNSACNPITCTPDWKCELPFNGYEKDGCGNRRPNNACNPSTICTPNWHCEQPLNGYENNGCVCTGIYGDLNGDGIVDVVDRLYLEQYLAGKRNLDPCQMLKADVNSDGVVDATDLMMITNYYAGLNGAKGNTGNPVYDSVNRRGNIDCNPCVPNWQCEQPLNGYEEDGCGNRRTNASCNPTPGCVPIWQCEQPLNGYESDGCGNRRVNTNCNPTPIDKCSTLGPISRILCKANLPYINNPII